MCNLPLNLLHSEGLEISTSQLVVVVLHGWESSHRSAVVPALHHRLLYIHLWAQWLKERRLAMLSILVYTPVGNVVPLFLFCVYCCEAIH